MQPGSVVINNGIIESVVKDIGQLQVPTVDLGNLVVMPGLIDPHVHINEPGRTHWEGFNTATRAAAAGGVTTLVDMPLNSSPVTTSAHALELKVQAAQGQLYADTGFWGGLIPGSLSDLNPLLEHGALGIKVFLIHSGIPEFPEVTESDLREALPLLKAWGRPLLVHAEMAQPLAPKDGEIVNHNPGSYQTYLNSRPHNWETEAITLLVKLAQEYQCPIHIVHLSSALSLPILAKAREYAAVTVETCPHYFFFDSEHIPDGRPEYKCAPPIRDGKNNRQLWQALVAGNIDFVASDHSPAPPEMKALDSGNLQKAWGGISSLQFLLPLVWTYGQKQGLSIFRLSQLVSSSAAKFIGLEKRKGKLAPGFDADLVIWDPEEEFVVTPEIIQFRHPVSPYINCKLKGVVKRTYLRGNLVYCEGKICGDPLGEVILK